MSFHAIEPFGRFWSTFIIGVLSIALSASPSLVNEYLRYTTALGNIFAPMAGVLLADYLVIRRGRIDVHALFARRGAYWYFRGFNPAAFLCICLGFWLCTLRPASWLPAITGTIFTGGAYPLIFRVTTVRAKAPAGSLPEVET